MLQLARKIGQSIIINDTIEVSILSIQGKTVRLGIVCPTSSRVMRQEILAKVKTANEDAITSAVDHINHFRHITNV